MALSHTHSLCWLSIVKLLTLSFSLINCCKTTATKKKEERNQSRNNKTLKTIAGILLCTREYVMCSVYVTYHQNIIHHMHNSYITLKGIFFETEIKEIFPHKHFGSAKMLTWYKWVLSNHIRSMKGFLYRGAVLWRCYKETWKIIPLMELKSFYWIVMWTNGGDSGWITNTTTQDSQTYHFTDMLIRTPATRTFYVTPNDNIDLLTI